MESDQSPSSLCWPSPRIEVENLHPYTAPLEGRRQLLRLDFNENTIGPSPLVIEALQNIPPSHISIYPEYQGLREAVVKNLSSTKLATPLSPNHIGLFNGVDAAIHAIFHAYGERGDQLITTTPTFGYYTPCANMQGMKISNIPYKGENFIFPLHEIHTALLSQSPRLLFICNPNNPTGTRLPPEQILNLATKAPNTLVVVDELYEAFTGDSVMPIIDFRKIPNLLVLRSLSKTAGLAGLRIGFAIGHPDVVNRVSRVTGPYEINSFAVTAAFAALKDQDYVDNYVQEVSCAREWVKSQLIDSGIRHHIEGGNYFLMWPRRKASEIELALREEGILVRNMKGKPLIERSLRVSIGTRNQMMHFWSAFTKHEDMHNSP